MLPLLKQTSKEKVPNSGEGLIFFARKAAIRVMINYIYNQS